MIMAIRGLQMYKIIKFCRPFNSNFCSEVSIMAKLQSLIILFAVVSTTVASALPNTSFEVKRLIRVSKSEDPKWLTEEQIFELIRNKIHFRDVTKHQTPLVARVKSSFVIPEGIQFQETVESTISKINITRVENFLRNFTSFHNRYYNSESGAESSAWLFDQVVNVYSSIEYPGSVNLARVEHTGWIQKSVIARIEGSDEALKEEVVILGAHLDSLNMFAGATGRSPGADDDGSGSAVLLEAFTTLLESGFQPKRSIEFQWYAAEELGLLGSGEIADEYVKLNISVATMLNFDIVGYQEDVRSVAFTLDMTDPDLTEFLRKIADTYLEYTWINRTCGYACSDYASWYEAGFTAASTKQAVVNPYMHTEDDTFEIVNFEQVGEFIKLAIGYAIEISEPIASA